MNTVSEIKWEIELIQGAIDYYRSAQILASGYESHVRYGQTIKKLESQMFDLKLSLEGKMNEQRTSSDC